MKKIAVFLILILILQFYIPVYAGTGENDHGFAHWIRTELTCWEILSGCDWKAHPSGSYYNVSGYVGRTWKQRSYYPYDWYYSNDYMTETFVLSQIRRSSDAIKYMDGTTAVHGENPNIIVKAWNWLYNAVTGLIEKIFTGWTFNFRNIDASLSLLGGAKIKVGEITVLKDSNYTTGNQSSGQITNPTGTPTWTQVYNYDVNVIDNSIDNSQNQTYTVEIKNQIGVVVSTVNINKSDIPTNGIYNINIDILGKDIPQAPGQYRIDIKDNASNTVVTYYYIISEPQEIKITNLTEGQQLNYIPYINISNARTDTTYLYVNNNQITSFTTKGQFAISPEQNGMIVGHNRIEIRQNTTTTSAILSINVDVMSNEVEQPGVPGDDQPTEEGGGLNLLSLFWALLLAVFGLVIAIFGLIRKAATYVYDLKNAGMSDPAMYSVSSYSDGQIGVQTFTHSSFLNDWVVQGLLFLKDIQLPIGISVWSLFEAMFTALAIFVVFKMVNRMITFFASGG
jgi:hypothetical protein